MARKKTVSPAQEKRKQATRQRILQHALELFQEKGFVNSSMNELVSRARCSMETIYRYFDNKEDLFSAILDEWLERNIGLMDRYTADHADLREGLLYISRIFIDELFTQQAVQIRNTMMFESMNRPELGALYYNDFTLKGYAFVERYFRKQQTAGNLRKDMNAKAISDYFVGMLICKYFFQRHFGVKKQMTGPEAAKFVKSIVDDFIKAFGNNELREL